MRFLTNDKVQSLVNKKGAIVADVRSPVQFRDDQVEGTINLPLRGLVNQLTLMSKNKKPIVLFANSTTDDDLKMAVTYSENLGYDTYITSAKELRKKV